MSEKLRFTIFLTAMGLTLISGNLIFGVGWVLFEWVLAWRNYTSRNPNGLFDQILEKVAELGFNVESVRSSDCEGEFNFETDG